MHSKWPTNGLRSCAKRLIYGIHPCYVKLGTKLAREVIFCHLFIQITILRSFQFPPYMSIFSQNLEFFYLYHGLRGLRWIYFSFKKAKILEESHTTQSAIWYEISQMISYARTTGMEFRGTIVEPTWDIAWCRQSHLPKIGVTPASVKDVGFLREFYVCRPCIVLNISPPTHTPNAKFRT